MQCALDFENLKFKIFGPLFLKINLYYLTLAYLIIVQDRKFTKIDMAMQAEIFEEIDEINTT